MKNFIRKKAEYYSKCSDKEWKKAMKMDKDIFKILPNIKKAVVGPKLTKDGTIIGNMFIAEKTLFYSYADENQKIFLESLERLNEKRAREYILTIIDGLNIWKKDIDILQYLLKLLKREIHEIEKGELGLSLEEEKLKRLSQKLNQYLGHDFLREDYATLHELVQDLKNKEEFLEDIKEKIEKELSTLKKEMSFLF